MRVGNKTKSHSVLPSGLWSKWERARTIAPSATAQTADGPAVDAAVGTELAKANAMPNTRPQIILDPKNRMRVRVSPGLLLALVESKESVRVTE